MSGIEFVIRRQEEVGVDDRGIHPLHAENYGAHFRSREIDGREIDKIISLQQRPLNIICRMRKRAEERGQDTSMFPPRERRV